MTAHELVGRTHHTMVRQQLVSGKPRMIVAVSGGADSVALLHVLVALRPLLQSTLHVAHLDHGLRGASREDAQFVQRLGVQWNVPTTIERRPVRDICHREGWSLEDGARRMRYQFFLDVARRVSAEYVALAHTADDQAETVLMRLLRGTGLTGLGAMPITRPLADAGEGAGIWVIRPLLEVWRRDILAYLEAHRLSYREDATNRDSRFLRNRIRHELLPLLEQHYNPRVKGALTQLAEQSRWDERYLQDAARRQWKRLVKIQAPSAVWIRVSSFLRQPKALQRHLVRQAVQSVRGDLMRFEFRHWREIERLFVERPLGTQLHLPGGVELRREEDRVLCRFVGDLPRVGLADDGAERYTTPP